MGRREPPLAVVLRRGGGGDVELFATMSREFTAMVAAVVVRAQPDVPGDAPPPPT